jgi:alpha-N-arabinofuranosidase
VYEGNSVWKASLPNGFFGDFNPYKVLLSGDWFDSKGRQHHVGEVYLDGDGYMEAATKNGLSTKRRWFSQVTIDSTFIWASFESDPSTKLAEINARQTVFYPGETGRNFITVSGFTMRHAATPWAPPTAEQIGLIGTNWSKGWVIENNIVSHSKCAGIALGKYGDEFDNTSADAAEGYILTIERARENGWNKATVGGHLVAGNSISDCEQAGIVGSLGAVFSTISGNTIHDIHVNNLFAGFEMAGIKIHAPIDMEISHNHIHRTIRGIWLDWMAQGTRVTGNLIHQSTDQDLFIEVNHGPVLVDNNLFLSGKNLTIWSSGYAIVHNLIAGSVGILPDSRKTPYHIPHSTEIVALHDIPTGDARYYNNILVGNANLGIYDNPDRPVFMGGNVFLDASRPSKFEPHPLTSASHNHGLEFTQAGDSAYLQIVLDKAWRTSRTRHIITSEILGKVSIANIPFEQPDGKPISIATDYFGKPRNAGNPFPGPFEQPPDGRFPVYGKKGIAAASNIPSAIGIRRSIRIDTRGMEGGILLSISAPPATGKAFLSIYDLSGKKIHGEPLFFEGPRQRVMLSGKHRGLHFVAVKAGQETMSGKITL